MSISSPQHSPTRIASRKSDCNRPRTLTGNAQPFSSNRTSAPHPETPLAWRARCSRLPRKCFREITRLTAAIPILCALGFLRSALELEGVHGGAQRPLITAQPSIPALILRDDAAPGQLSCRFAKIEFIVQDRFCIV